MNLYLIDGNSYVYRAFYAIKGLANSKGFPTNAVYGFTTMLLKIVREKKPDAMAVSFDTSAPTERHILFEDYKAKRRETPPDLIAQLPLIRKTVSALNISVFETPGYEADDIIGTLAGKAASEGIEVFIVTADKDMLQLVSDNIRIYDPMKDRLLDTAYVKEKFGVGPERVTEFMALTGDASDNIPGIRGIGEKTATELLAAFGSLEELLDHPERIKKDRLRQMIADNREIALLSRRLATINTEVPIEFDTASFRMKEPDWLRLLSIFRECEFTTLMKMIPTAAPAGKECETTSCAVSSLDRLLEITSTIRDEFVFDTETTGRNPLTARLVGLSLCITKDAAYYVPVGHTSEGKHSFEQIDKTAVINALRPFLEDEQISKTGHNLKFDIMVLRQEGIEIKGRLYDTMLAAYLLNPNKSAHSLEEVAFEYLGKRKKSFTEVLKKRATFAEVGIEEATVYAGEDAALSCELKQLLFERLKENGLDNIYFETDMPLVFVLADMERAGIRIDAEKLTALSGELAVEIDSLQKRIFFLAGEEFNINSPKQLSAVLFHSLGLRPTKKTKTGFSTDVDVLEELAEVHDLPREVLAYRSLTKLKTTYLDVLPALADPLTGRVHTSFNQTVTATGRLSSSDPNLQNIPVRGVWGRRIREAFIADEGCLLLSADYSQVELRILAHLSGDSGLIDAFTGGLDIHTRTAAELYGVSPEKVTSDMRRVAKTVNFGVIYGISSYGLSEALNIERKDAEKYIKHYFERHPGVREYTERIIAETRERGYVSTLAGRRRAVPELQSSNRNTRQLGERLAVNSPIQGTAADIIKAAMINIRRRLDAGAMRARMILQVHDELLFELPEEELDAVRELVRQEMEGVVCLSVPLKVEIGYGKDWAAAHA